MDVVRNRMTNRTFVPFDVPRAHFELILEAARHAPSGANAQPRIGQCFVDEQQRRAKLRLGFPTPNYNGVKTAPGLIVIAADFRFIRAFPVLNDGSDADRLYRQNAERILLQSVAASTTLVSAVRDFFRKHPKVAGLRLGFVVLLASGAALMSGRCATSASGGPRGST